MMELWVSKAMADNIFVTGEVLHQKWTRFATLASVPEDKRLNLSDSWLSQFKARNGLMHFKCYGEAALPDSTTVDNE
jgi:hypothetical protein